MGMKRLYLSVPHMGENEERYVQDAFRSNWLSTVGPTSRSGRARCAIRAFDPTPIDVPTPLGWLDAVLMVGVPASEAPTAQSEPLGSVRRIILACAAGRRPARRSVAVTAAARPTSTTAADAAPQPCATAATSSASAGTLMSLVRHFTTGIEPPRSDATRPPPTQRTDVAQVVQPC